MKQREALQSKPRSSNPARKSESASTQNHGKHEQLAGPQPGRESNSHLEEFNKIYSEFNHHFEESQKQNRQTTANQEAPYSSNPDWMAGNTMISDQFAQLKISTPGDVRNAAQVRAFETKQHNEG